MQSAVNQMMNWDVLNSPEECTHVHGFNDVCEMIVFWMCIAVAKERRSLESDAASVTSLSQILSNSSRRRNH